MILRRFVVCLREKYHDECKCAVIAADASHRAGDNQDLSDCRPVRSLFTDETAALHVMQLAKGSSPIGA
jgi:hypothetical protein